MKLLIRSITVFLILLSTSAAFAQTTEFTYQGRLLDGTLPPTANYDFEFSLWDTLVSGTQAGSTQTVTGVAVVNGTFTVRLNFGAQFSGPPRFLQIAVRAAGGGAYTTLAPRQAITSAPYAIRSANSAAADTAATANNASSLGGVPASQYVQTSDPRMTDARTPLPGSTDYVQNGTAQQASSNFNISGTGTANIFSAATQYNLGGSRFLSAPGSNIFAGIGAGALNTTGINNSYFGEGAGQNNTVSSDNSFFGFNAGRNTTSSNNSFFGSQAGLNTTGPNNSFFGYAAGANNFAGFSNAFFGDLAGLNNINGTNNTLVGSSAGRNNNGNGNAFFGAQTGFRNTDGSNNSFFGFNAGLNNTTSSNNSFFGAQAGQNTTGPNNSFFGFGAGFNNTIGFSNAFFGDLAGVGNIAGTNNTLVGSSAGRNTTSNNNSFFGAQAGRSNTTSSNNSFFGSQAGLNTSGPNNSFFGYSAGGNTTIGFSNAFFGDIAGISNTIGTNNTIIGSGANVGAGNLGFATAIGASSVVSTSNSIVLGRNTGEDKVGIGTDAPTEKLTVRTAPNSFGLLHTDGSISLASFVGGAGNGAYIGTVSNHPLYFYVGNGSAVVGIDTTGVMRLGILGGAGTTPLCRNGLTQISFCSSSLRYKTNIGKFSQGMSFVNKLSPISYDWKTDGTKDIGFGAEDIAKIDPRFVTYNDKGEVEGVKYDRLSVAFVNAFKEQQAEISELRAVSSEQAKKIEEQSSKLKDQQSQIDALKKLVCAQNQTAEICKEEK